MAGESRPFRVNPDRLKEGWFLFLSDGARLAYFYLEGHIRTKGDRNGRVYGFEVAVFAHESRVSVEAVEELLAAEGCPLALDGKVLSDREWPDLQASESKDRVQRHREKKAHVTLQVVQGGPQETPQEADVTLQPVTNPNVTACNVTGRYNEAKGSPPLAGPPSPQHSPPPPISPPLQNSHPARGGLKPKPEPSPEAWTEFCQTYPKRSGDLNKTRAERGYGALIRGGADPVAIQAGVEKYRAWCDATGKTGTELVKQMTTWLNGRGWLEDYDVPAVATGAPLANGRPMASTHDRLRQGSRFARP